VPHETVLDIDLVTAYRERGDQSAFAELVRRYREPVFRVALSILGPAFAAEAEEVAQEVFVRVHHAIASFRGEAQFSSWVYRIAFNQAINVKQRSRYRRPHLPEDVLAVNPSPAADPLRQLEESVQRTLVMECVEELPEIYQAALRLHYWMGESMDETAELLGVAPGTVKSYLHRARGLLHGMLKERGMDHA
jgi:RNA polymerase sigma-70 factor (ECF subfamily)